MRWRESSQGKANQAPFWRQSEVERRRSDALAAIKAAARNGRPGELSLQVDRALFLDDMMAAVSKNMAEPEPPAPPPPPVKNGNRRRKSMFIRLAPSSSGSVTTSLLETARGDSNGGEAESVALISGTKLGAIRTWDRLVRTPVSYRSKVGAVIDSSGLGKDLRRLDAYGHALYGVSHLHLHHGPPRPSSTDIALSDKLEKGGYPAIQAVFSQSGHIRFFSSNREFEVMIYGNGIEKLDHRLFRLASAANSTPL